MRKTFTRLLLSSLFFMPFALLAGGGCALTLSHVVTDETCPGFYDGSITLTPAGANGSVTYNWSNGATTQNISSLTSGTYTVTATDQLGCMAYDTCVVIAAYAISVDLGPDTALCEITNFLLVGTTPGAVFYYWQDGSQDSIYYANGPGLYTCFVDNAFGCYDEDTIVLSQHSIPDPAIATTHPSCGATLGALDLTVGSGTPPYSYLWTTGDTVEDLVSLATGSYAVSVTDSNGCVNTTNAHVIAPVNLSDFVLGAPRVCSSHTIQFTPLQYGIEFDGVDDYIAVPDSPSIRPGAQWTIEAWIMPTGGAGPAQTVIEKRTASEDGYSIRYDPVTKTLSARLQNGPLLIQFNPFNILPLYQWTHIAMVVNGDNVRFFVNGVMTNDETYSGGVNPTIGSALTIGGGPNRQSFRGRMDEVIHWTLPLTAAEVEELRIKNLPSGLSGLGLFLNFNELPGGGTATDRSANVLPVNLVNIDTAQAWIQTNPLSQNFIWDFGDGTVNNSQAPYHGYLPRVWQTMVVTLTVTSDQGCQTMDTLPLPVHTPAVPFINADSGNAYCLGDTVTLWMQAGYPSYSWSNGSTNDTIEVLASALVTGTADDQLGCVHTGSLPINFHPNTVPIPVIVPGGNQTICEGDSLVLDVGSGYTYYLWNTGDTLSSMYATVTDTYFVTVQNGFGCERTSAPVTVMAYPAPVAIITGNGNILTASAGLSYQWFLDSIAIPGAITDTFTALSSGNYTVLVGGQGGCTAMSDPYAFALGLVDEVYAWGEAMVFPNPTAGTAIVQLNLKKPAQFMLMITDLSGRILMESSLRQGTGSHALLLPLEEFAQGMYLVHLKGDEIQWTTRVSKM